MMWLWLMHSHQILKQPLFCSLVRTAGASPKQSNKEKLQHAQRIKNNVSESGLDHPRSWYAVDNAERTLKQAG
jgi:hypothetical protein